MKKFLSLVLALVMTMSLVTISAGAKDFTDADKVNYAEAIDVMSAVKVIDGYTDGSFNPQGTLTRGAAAKIICNMILGPTTAAALVADAAPFKDVPVDHTFAGYIAFCAKEGIISGYADGTFKPGATLTSYAYMKMLLGALGYDQEVEGYTGANWSINVAKRALNIGLTKGLKEDFNGIKAVTREEACLYALNTLKADMVEYDTKTSISIGDAAVVIAGSAAKPVDYKDGKYDGNIEGGEKVQQFAEKYFTDLKLSTENGVYGRPSNKWTLKKTEIGTYASVDPTYVYSKKVNSDDLYKEVGKEIATEYDWDVKYVDGVKNDGNFKPANADTTYQNTAKGLLTEIYVNDAKKEVTVIQINTYLTQVSKVREDDDGTYVTVDKKGIKENKFYTDDFKADDYVLITLDINDDGDSYIASLKAPETVEGTITAVNQQENPDDLKGSYVKLDGEKKEYAYDCLGDLDNSDKIPALSTEYKLYLDEYGYVKGFVALENLYDQYLYVIETDWTLGTVKASVLMADGTIQTITVKDELQDGTDLTKANTAGLIETWACAYDVDSKDVYTLKPITKTTHDGVTVKDGKAYGAGVSYVIDADTIFSDKKDKVSYTGYEAVPEYTGAKIIIVEDSKTISNVVFVLDWATKSTVDDFYFYVADYKDFETYKTDKKLVQRTVFVDGVKDSKFIMTKDASNTVVANENGLYQVKGRDTDGNVNKVEFIGDVAAFAKDTVSIVGNKSFVSTQTEVSAGKNNTEGTGKWTFDDETTFVFIEKDKDGKYTKVTTGPAKSIDVYKAGMADTDDVSLVRVVKAKDAKALLVYVVAAKVADLNTAEKEAAKAADKAIADAKAVLATVSDYSGAELTTLMTKLGDAKKALMSVDKTKLSVEKLAEVNSTIDALTDANTTAGNDYAKYLADEQTKKDTEAAKVPALATINGYETRLNKTGVIAEMNPTDAVNLTNAIAEAKKLVNGALNVASVNIGLSKITDPMIDALEAAEKIVADKATVAEKKAALKDVTLEGVAFTSAARPDGDDVIAALADANYYAVVLGDWTESVDKESVSCTATVTIKAGDQTDTKGITVTAPQNDYVALNDAVEAMPTTVTFEITATGADIAARTVSGKIAAAIAAELGSDFGVTVKSGAAKIVAADSVAGKLVAQSVVVSAIKYNPTGITHTENFNVDLIIKVVAP